MKINVVFLGSAKSYTDDETIVIEIDALSTVANVVTKVIVTQPRIQKIMKYLFVSVNNELVPRSQIVSENDEIAFFTRPGGG
jgi:molybdopterin converting factor small subunit